MAAFKLYVRGAAAAVLVDDLGFTVPQGPGWTQLNSDSPGAGLGDSGQFTARELRDSADLAALIGAGTLDWSKDGVNAELSGDYVADFMLMQDFTDDHLDLTSGILTVPTGDEPPLAGQEGNIWWDAGDHGLYMHDGANWMLVATSSGVQNDHGALSGLGDDDHPQYHDGSLPWTGNLNMGGNSISGVNLVDGVDVSSLYDTVTGLSADLSAHELDTTIHFTVGSIDHTLIQNIGTNSHSQIDSHIADTTIHFPVSGIDHGSIAGLGDDDHPQYLLLDGDTTRNAVTGSIDMTSGQYFVLPQANDVSSTFLNGQEGALAWDIDDNALYAYDGLQWFAIAPASGIITDHGGLTGLLDDDHPQYHDGSLAYTGNLDMGGNSISGVNLVDGVDVSQLKSDFDSHSGDATIHFTVGSIDHGLLQGLSDDDHPQYTQWAQDETVTGVWTFDPADTSPNFILEPVAVAPVNNLADGAIAVIAGILCAYDSTRGKWLSVDRKILTGSKDGAAKDVYLRHDNIAMSQTGLRALRDGTVTGIFLQTDVAATWTLEVRRNGTVTVLASLASGGAQGAQSATINADFSAGDELQLYANTSGAAILAPIAGIEIAWRF
jgi:hypothetical protein